MPERSGGKRQENVFTIGIFIFDDAMKLLKGWPEPPVVCFIFWRSIHFMIMWA